MKIHHKILMVLKYTEAGLSQRECSFKLDISKVRHLFSILENRYGIRSTIVTSQYPISNWYELIPNATFADAILDRLVHNSYRIELVGKSKRETLSN